MAYIKTPKNKITSRAALQRVVKYITNPDKTLNGRLLYYNQCSDNPTTDFYNIKKQYGVVNEKLVAFQFVQSFNRDECDPDTAFEIAKELAEKVFPGYQYVIATHVDAKNVINSHIVINSVSYLSGLRYHDNKESLAIVRKASDELCRQYGLSVIDNPTGRKSIDKTTYEMAMKGKSWKARLANDLDDILEICKTKDEFISLLESKGYSVKYRDVNILITKNGEAKGIRVDTLAKQFGSQYKKENIELHFGIKKANTQPDRQSNSSMPEADETKCEWARYERQYFSQRVNIDANKQSAVINSTVRKMLFLRRSIDNSQRLLPALIRCLMLGIYLIRKQDRQAYSAAVTNKSYLYSQQYGGKRSYAPDKPYERHVGNISYNRLSHTYGENATLSVTMEQLIQFEKMNIFYTGVIKNEGTVSVTIKESNIPVVCNVLGISNDKIFKNTATREELFRHKMMKECANRYNRNLLSMRVNREALEKLDANGIPFSYFKRGNRDSYSMYFFNSDLRAVCEILHMDVVTEQEWHENILNKKLYYELKNDAACYGEKLEYRVIDSNGVQLLKNANLKFAYFKKSDNSINVAFLKNDEEIYNKAIAMKQHNEKESQKQDEQYNNRRSR